PFYEAEKARVEKEAADKKEVKGEEEKTDQVDSEKKEEQINADVYSRAECPFNYCDDPEVCKSLDRCHHRPVDNTTNMGIDLAVGDNFLD
ncbi:MAG: hypothetical protein ACYC5G_04345, partial [Candidatus Doudnabacteria bacterium]